MSRLDLVVRGGRVMDLTTGMLVRADIGVERGRIVALEGDLSSEIVPAPAWQRATNVIDAHGAVVVPGLIDLHVHVFPGATRLGISADGTAATSGVTTAVSAGDAGAQTIEAFRDQVSGRSRTRVLAFMHVSRTGLAPYPKPESADLGLLDVPAAIEAARRFPDLVAGIKVRQGGLDVSGTSGLQPLHRALDVAATTNLPVMVHITGSQVPFTDLAALLRPGDIITHAFTGSPNGLVEDGRLLPAVFEARERGILFDVGHGAGSFSFQTAEVAAAAAFWPDTISTDLHRYSAQRARDLPFVMDKLLAVGMPLGSVLAAVTQGPALALRQADRLGRLEIGREADIAVIDVVAERTVFEDTSGGLLEGFRRLRVRTTLRAGIPWVSRAAPACRSRRAR